MPIGYWNEDDYTLQTSMAVLDGRLAELLRREANADAAGITCSIKDLPDMTCSACPVCEEGQNTRKSALCRLGREMERVMALATVKRHGDGGHPDGG